MTKPHWQILHDGWMSDFRFEFEQKEAFKALLIRHPSDGMSDGFRAAIKLIDKNVQRMASIYRRTYGDRPRWSKIRNV